MSLSLCVVVLSYYFYHLFLQSQYVFIHDMTRQLVVSCIDIIITSCFLLDHYVYCHEIILTYVDSFDFYKVTHSLKLYTQ